MIISVKEIKKFIICVAIPLLTGILSSTIAVLLSQTSFEMQYLQLIKPDFAPPSTVYPIIWPILYILMGISAYIIKSSKKSTQKINDAMFLYYVQLVLNFLWSILFFGLNLRFVAFVDSILLGLVLIAMIYKFYKIDQRASLINIPYLLWIFFVIFLSYFIWILNK
ncbi:TspO/MBR family protein [Intestinibacter sp.]|uniref:TspO/MBR family protein n=1 Tax=Intestinibacter sp. TaxID=1965304 RepID=UPI002A9141BB|nr:TspO/MBR family protein [Intestinibacter sp.]MDY5211653.1 TspO/MBR family protein [Intestinibacter sp.]